jgi:hypothetical protein
MSLQIHQSRISATHSMALFSLQVARLTSMDFAQLAAALVESMSRRKHDSPI